MYFTMGHMVGLPQPHWYHGTENAMVAALLQFFLTLPVVYLNRVYYTRGLTSLWHRAPNMDSLIAVGSGAALLYGIAALFRMAIGAGTDVAIESADVVLMSSSLMGATYAIQLSKATICNIRQNLFWAFFYNCLGIPIAAGVLYPAFGLPSVPCWAPPL